MSAGGVSEGGGEMCTVPSLPAKSLASLLASMRLHRLARSTFFLFFFDFLVCKSARGVKKIIKGLRPQQNGCSIEEN